MPNKYIDEHLKYNPISPKTSSQMELDNAVASSTSRILRDPTASSMGNTNKYILGAQNVASGKKQDKGGIGGMVADSFMDALSNVGYVFGTPVRAIASVAKETGDLVTGNGASLKDLFTQTADKQFYPSTIIAKSGNKWVDGIVGLTADVLSDPLTYVSFGASSFAGRSGRLSLAAKAAESDNLVQAPSLLAKIQDGSIAARGEFALDDFERQVLNVPKGVRYHIGGQLVGKEGSLVRKGSEKVSEAVGGSWASFRSRLGDFPAFKPLQDITASKTIKSAGLMDYGRAGVNWAPKTARTTNEIITSLAGYSASSRGKGMGKLFVARIGAKGQKLGADLANYESTTGRKLVEVIEGSRAAVDAEEQFYADAITGFLAEVRQAGNEVTQTFATRRNVRAMDIGFLDNYIPHSLSADTKQWLATKRWRGGKFETSIKNMLDQTPEEFISGPNVMRARKLQAGKEFLGETLVGDAAGQVTMKEINDISMAKLGFNWFEDDAATYLNSYINSVGAQAKRVGFTDRLFDYGVDIVRGIDYKLIPDRKVINAMRASIAVYQKAIKDITGDVTNLNKTVGSITKQQRALAARVVNAADKRMIFTQAEVDRLTINLAEARLKLQVAEDLARVKGGEIEAAFNTAIAPYKARLDAIEGSLANGRQDEIIATMQLEEIHNKMFPTMKNRPKDPTKMAEQILAKTESTTGSKIRMLETRRARLQRTITAKGKVGRADIAAKEQLALAEQELEVIEQQLLDYSIASEHITKEFPDGVMFIYRSDIDPVTGNIREGGITAFPIVPEGVPPEQMMMIYAPIGADPINGMGARILQPWESGEDYLDLLDVMGTGIGKAIADAGDWQLGEAFGQQWDEIMQSQYGGGRALDPSFAAQEPDLANILARVDKMGRRDFNKMTPKEFSMLFDSDMENIANMLDNYLAKASQDPSFPQGIYDDGLHMLRYAVGHAGDTSMGWNDIVGINLGDFPIFGDATGVVLHSNHLERYIEPVADSSILWQEMTDGKIADSTSAMFEATGRAQEARASRGAAYDAAQQTKNDIAAKKLEAGAVGRKVGGAKRSKASIEAKVTEATEQYGKAQELPVVNAKGETILVPKGTADEMATKVSKTIERKTKALAKEMRNDPLMVAAADETRAVGKVASTLDAKQAILENMDEWEATFGNAYRSDLQALSDQLASKPTSGVAAEVQLEWSRKTDEMFANLEQATLSGPQKVALTQVLTQLKAQEVNLAFAEQYLQFGETQLAKALTGEVGGKMVADIKQGWAKIEQLGVQMSPELKERLFGKIESLSNAAEWGKFKSAYMAYHRFFKITAMLTPGFIVRNSYTAAFNNFVAGVSLKETRQGIMFAKNVFRYGADEALLMVPASERALYEQAYSTVLATGGGQTADDFLYPILEGKGAKWVNAKPVKIWTKTNETAEVAARMSLALSSLNKGLDFDAAAAQIARYHFDYTDLSSLDEFAKQFVPFWVFATRNIPLQITNQIARPSLYRAYESTQRNFKPDENLILPTWLANRNPLGFGGGSVLNPDLPQIDMADQIRMLSDPQRLVSQLNPLIKLPIELMGERQLGTDTPFSTKPQAVRGPLDLPSALAGALFGQTDYNANGDLLMSSKAQYALPNLLPTLATLQRLLPQLGGKEAYVDRQSSSVLGALGVPWRGISQAEQAATLTGRQFALKDYLSKLTSGGYLQPTNSRGGYR